MKNIIALTLFVLGSLGPITAASHQLTVLPECKKVPARFVVNVIAIHHDGASGIRYLGSGYIDTSGHIVSVAHLTHPPNRPPRRDSVYYAVYYDCSVSAIAPIIITDTADIAIFMPKYKPPTVTGLSGNYRPTVDEEVLVPEAPLDGMAMQGRAYAYATTASGNKYLATTNTYPKGFSGKPVLSATGRLIGIVQGYNSSGEGRVLLADTLPRHHKRVSHMATEKYLTNTSDTLY